MPKEAKPTNLEKVFPDKKLTVDGLTVTVKPLSMEDIPSVATSIVRIIELKSEGKSDQEIGLTAINDIFAIIKLCVDVPLRDIPGFLTPTIIRIVLKQNITEDLVGEYGALLNDVVAAFNLQGKV